MSLCSIRSAALGSFNVPKWVSIKAAGLAAVVIEQISIVLSILLLQHILFFASAICHETCAVALAKLTIGGERLLPHARKICQEWKLAHQSIESLLAGEQPELYVAAINSVCAHLLPPILQQFCDRYPQVQLRVTVLGSDRGLKVLKDGLVDIAIVMDDRMLTTSPDMVVQNLY